MLSFLTIITMLTDAVAILWLLGVTASGVAVYDSPPIIQLTWRNIAYTFVSIIKLADLRRITYMSDHKIAVYWISGSIIVLFTATVTLHHAFTYEIGEEKSKLLKAMPRLGQFLCIGLLIGQYILFKNS